MTTAGRWDVALAEYEAALVARGYYSASSCAALLKRARRYAQECGHASPWEATPGRIEKWLDGLTDVSVRSVYDYRVGLRTFFRWAVESGRMASDPTAELWGRQQELEAPMAWMHAIAAWGNYLSASGVSRGTARLRRYQVITLGRTVGVSEPWLVTEDDLVDWFGSRRNWSRATLKAYRSAVRTFYAWALRIGHMDHNPADVLPSVPQRPPLPRPAAEDEVVRAMATADDRVRLLIRMCAELGLRIGEACKVHTRDLQRGNDGGWWLYVVGKGQRTRRLPVPDGLAQAMLDRDPGFLFPGNSDGHLKSNYAGKLVAKQLPEGVTAHMLRHRFGTQAYRVTGDVLAVQQLLGHASPVTTQGYVAVAPDSLRRLVCAVTV